LRHFLLGSLFFLFLFFVFFPQILSLPYFKPLFIRAAQAKVHGQLSVQKVRLSWLGPQEFDQVQFADRDLHLSMDQFTSPVPLWSLGKMGALFGIKNGELTFPSYPSASIQQINGNIRNGQFSLTALTKEGPQTGHIQIHGADQRPTQFNGNFDIENLPVIALDRLLDTRDWLSEILGKELNFRGTLTQQETRSLTFDVQSPLVKTHLEGIWNSKGLTLQKPLHIDWTPAFSFLASSPLTTIDIPVEGFFFPIPFSLADLSIPLSTCTAGQFLCKKQGSLQTLSAFLEPHTALGQTIDLWFTPLYFQIKRQVLTLERLDALLAHSIHVCTWGTISLQKQKYHLSLGLPADMLKKVFKISNLPEDYVLTIPLRGPLNNPTLATGPAALKIAAMVASEKIPKTKGLAGGILKIFSAPPLEKESAPPPHRPFPWEL
jgi:hypothetical protein